ncbi:MarC family integral membrane protein [Candidatus Anstonella stagnisolia]|nr:MarC family integral membrane protein [Candidatus Anstonella stagnisolia]
MVEIALEAILKSLIAFFVIMDPFASLPAFLALTKKMNEVQRAQAAFTATVVAGGVIIGFALVGVQLLGVLGISMQSFQIAGGLLLLLTAIQITFGINFGKEEKSAPNVAIVLIGVPLLAGPGAMTTAVLLTGADGILVVVIAALAATVLSYVILMCASFIGKILGARGMEISSRLMGILLAAIGVEFIRMGLGG